MNAYFGRVELDTPPQNFNSLLRTHVPLHIGYEACRVLLEPFLIHQ